MPIYEYACHDCGEIFETIQSSSDAPAPSCPKCASDKVDRCLSAPARCGGLDRDLGLTAPVGGCGSGGFS